LVESWDRSEQAAAAASDDVANSPKAIMFGAVLSIAGMA
jgi:hypothetical protein